MGRRQHVHAVEALPPTYQCQALEPRRLLTYTVFGTAGNDAFLVAPGGSGYIVTLNGVQVANSSDLNVVISPLGGSDEVVIPTVLNGASITVRGGLGDDYLQTGGGSLFSNLRGHLYFEEFAGEGNDQFFADDELDTSPDRAVRLRDNLLTSGTGTTVGAHFDDNVEIKTLLGSASPDTVYVESPPLGMNLFLGGGDDYVEFGSVTANDLPDFMKPGTVTGGAGNDLLVFDDAGQNDSGALDYPVTPTRFCNQFLSGVERTELNTRSVHAPSNLNNVIFSGGAGVSQSITVRGDSRTWAYIGTETAPTDMDALTVALDLDVARLIVHDQDVNNSAQPFLLYTAAGTRPQRVVKGALNVLLPSNAEIDLFGGSTNDQFAIGGVVPESYITIDGGGGNDSVYTVNLNGHDNDLDEIFVGSAFYFWGGPGNDSLDLDDSADQMGDGDEVYWLNGEALDKGFGEFIRWGTSPSGFDEAVELVRLKTGAGVENNTIYFRGPSTFGRAVNYEIDAGAGDDYITNSTAIDLSWSDHHATIVGGAGNDTLVIDDTGDNGDSGFYRFEPGYRLAAASSMTYDATLENLTLETTPQKSIVEVNAKPPGMRLTVNGHGGDDVFTVGGGDIDTNGFFNNTTISGGAGTDAITFDDRLDDYQSAVNENETYTLENNSFRKDTGSLSYFAFEEQTIRTADMLNGSFLIDNTVNINNFSINFAKTTVLGGGVRGNSVHVSTPSTGNISNLVGDFAFHLGTSGGNVVYLNDHANQQSAQYAVQSASLSRSINFANPRTFAYSGLNYLVINGGPAGDLIEFYSTPAGMIAIGNGNAGNDTLGLGGGGGVSIGAGLLGRVDLDGGANFDSLFIDNSLNAVANIAAFTGSTFAIDAGPVHNYTGFEGATVFLGNGSTDARIKGASIPTQVYGGSAGDTFTFGNGDIDANVPFGVTVDMDGGGGTDHIRLDDVNDATAGFDNQYFVQSVGSRDTLIRRPGSFALQWTPATWAGFESTLLDASNVNATIEVQAVLAPLRVSGNAGSDTIRVGDAMSPVTVNGGAGLDALLVNSDWDGGSDQPVTVVVDVPDDLSAIEIRTGGTLRIVSGAVVSLQYPAPFAPILNMVGTIDLAGGALLVQGNTTGGSLATLRSQIVSGRNGGAWNGTSPGGAINSSLAASTPMNDAVGYGTGAQVPKAIGGFIIAADDTLIRYVLGGDATLNGKVNIDDYGRIDGNVAQSGSVFGWAVGDFNYDDKINIDDYGIIDSNISQVFPTTAEPGWVRQDEVTQSGATVRQPHTEEPQAALTSAWSALNAQEEDLQREDSQTRAHDHRRRLLPSWLT